MKKLLLIPLSVLCVLLLSAFVEQHPSAAPLPQAGTGRFFAETRHYVGAPFLKFYETTGDMPRYGAPITEQFNDPKSGLLVQYFQLVRFEYHPTNPEPYKVLLGLLGDEMGQRTPGLTVREMSRPDPNCQYFEATGHRACWKFLEYWRNNGGLDRFGYPIAEYTIENHQIVQYFQRAKMEWHPEKPEGQRVQLAPLGRMHFDFAKLDPNLLNPPQGDNIPSPASTVTKLQAVASVLDPVAASGTLQVGFVQVRDQVNVAVENAAVTLIIHYPQGDEKFMLPRTNANGSSYHTFTVKAVAPGKIVPMEYIVTYNNLTTKTKASFMVWFSPAP